MKKEYSVERITYYRIKTSKGKETYSDYKELDGGFAKVMRNGRWGILGPQGNIWGHMVYTNIYEFHEDMIRVEKKGKYGYMDRDSGRIIPCIYESASDFHNGQADVVYNGKAYTINTVGKVINQKREIVEM